MRDGRHVTVLVKVGYPLPLQEITSDSNIDNRIGINADSSGRAKKYSQEAQSGDAEYNRAKERSSAPNHESIHCC